MVESDECLFDVWEYGEVDLVEIIFPVKVNAEKALTCPTMGDSVMILEDSHEVLHMLFTYIFDSKVVDAKLEADQESGVCPETGVKCTLPLSFRV